MDPIQIVELSEVHVNVVVESIILVNHPIVALNASPTMIASVQKLVYNLNVLIHAQSMFVLRPRCVSPSIMLQFVLVQVSQPFCFNHKNSINITD